MARRTNIKNPVELRSQLLKVISEFEIRLENGSLREQVRSLIPAHYILRDLGSSLMGHEAPSGAKSRILSYLKQYQGAVIEGDELMIVAGISEYARRIRELRVEFGWKIVSGMSKTTTNTVLTDGPPKPVELLSLIEERDDAEDEDVFHQLKPDQYVLVSPKQDKETAFRWKRANEIKREPGISVRDKILKLLRENVGSELLGEEFRYVAGNKTEWARRVRELRTEYGWPITTKTTGRPDLPVGVYLLEADRQAPQHDRTIKDPVRRRVFRRDSYSCDCCDWNRSLWNEDDPRHLEAHHIVEHVKGGTNEEQNLVTLCNICHDEVHAIGRDKAYRKPTRP
jgi:hypothetical protein